MEKRSFPVTTVILAGGQGRRIGGNKGLQLLLGMPLISWVLKPVLGHSAEVFINVNGEQTPYHRFQCKLISDLLPGWQGPLAGIQAALSNAQTEYVMSVPCDTPFLPDGLIPQLYEALTSSGAEAAVAVTDGQRQPAIALFRKSVLPGLVSFLNSEQRKVNDWLDTLRLCEVEFESADAFDNINSAEDMARAELRLVKQGVHAMVDK